MNRLENLLTILVEECCETGQRATKAQRFGIHEIQPGQELKNSERLIYEFNDLYAVMELLQEHGYIDRIVDREYIELKKAKIEKYAEYSILQGTLTDDRPPKVVDEEGDTDH